MKRRTLLCGPVVLAQPLVDELALRLEEFAKLYNEFVGQYNQGLNCTLQYHKKLERAWRAVEQAEGWPKSNAKK